MAKKLNSMPDYQARMPKQPHDVSQSTALTAAPGMLLPVYYDMLHLGDELHFNANLFGRLNPLSIASLGDIDVHLDYFFVPLTVLYTPTSSLFYQTDDLVSSMFASFRNNPSFYEGFPTMDVGQYINTLVTNPSFPTFQSVMYGDDSSAVKLPADRFDLLITSLYRMFDLFDMNPNILMLNTNINNENYPAFTPWFPLAYQAIYQLYFRNDDREPKNYHYNIDVWAQGGVPEDPTPQSSKSIFALNYASRSKDYFNSVKVSPIGSSVSMLGGVASYSLFNQVNNWINGTRAVVYGSDGYVTTARGGMSNATTVIQASPTAPLPPSQSLSLTGVSSSGIRQVFMIEKLLRVIGRADKNYESQFLAHFGVKIPHDVMHNITHIGHDMVTFSPELIMSTANTWNGSTGSALGEIGGQGQFSLRGKKRNFKAPFHGVFMCIMHFQPRMRYVAGFNKLHQLNSPLDFWQPEFDRKGMQPIFGYEADLPDSNFTTGRLGWQYAYEQFKRKYDRVTHAFAGPINDTQTVNTYSPWVISVRPYSALANDGTLLESPISLNPNSPNLQAYHFLASPNDLNGIMQVPHTTQWSEAFRESPWLIYQTDPLICDFFMNCKKVNFMSEYGEPEL